jgi:hypothetical protein
MFFDVTRSMTMPCVASDILLERIASDIQTRKGRISARTATSLEFRSSFWQGRYFLRATLGGVSYGRVWLECRNDIIIAHFGLALTEARYFLTFYTFLILLGPLNQGFDKQTVFFFVLGIFFAWGIIYSLTRFVALACFRNLLRGTAANVTGLAKTTFIEPEESRIQV